MYEINKHTEPEIEPALKPVKYARLFIKPGISLRFKAKK
jgi:hypothetical protein